MGMSKKLVDSLLALNRTWFYVLTVGGGLVLLVVSGWFGWQRIYLKPERVFWSMMDTNLSTPGIAKRVTQNSSGANMQQDVQLSFGADSAVHSISTLVQPGADGKQSKVVTETIGGVDADYVRYTDIHVAELEAKGKQDYKGVKGVWGKTPKSEGKRTGQLLTESLLNTVPFANVSRDKRVSLIEAMRSKKVYEVDFDKTRRTSEHGRDVLVYPVKIYPHAYVGLLKQFGQDIGLGELPELDAASYEGAPATSVEFVVERASRQLVAVRYGGKDREETYASYGVETPVTMPKDAIPMSELQSRIQRLQSSAEQQ